MGNTVGSQRKNDNYFNAYMAGFLDGDGCIAIQIERRTSYRLGYKARVRVSFTQHRRQRRVLDYLYRRIGSGAIAEYQHNNMAEYVIRDQKVVERLLNGIKPFVVVKQKQLEFALKLLEVKRKGYTPATIRKMLHLSELMGRQNNYPKRIFPLDPVTTEGKPKS